MPCQCAMGPVNYKVNWLERLTGLMSWLNLNYTFPMWKTMLLKLISLPSALCLCGLSQHVLTSPLCWVSYSLSLPSAPCTPCRQITTLAGDAQSNTKTSKFSSLWLFQVHKLLQLQMYVRWQAGIHVHLHLLNQIFSGNWGTCSEQNACHQSFHIHARRIHLCTAPKL